MAMARNQRCVAIQMCLFFVLAALCGLRKVDDRHVTMFPPSRGVKRAAQRDMLRNGRLDQPIWAIPPGV
jgi:hypothetical protein